MSKKEHIEEYEELLLKWLDGDLSAEDRTRLESDVRFAEDQRIMHGTKMLEVPKVDQDQLLGRIKDNIADRKTETSKVIPLWKKLATVAAVAVCLLAVVVLLDSDISVDSYDAIQISHVLPDASQVILNSDSELSYAENFTDERILELKGEAFFAVERGQSFTVVTDYGDVTVLGTSFNVWARDGALVVSCKTGKVKVQNDTQEKVISPGERVRFSKDSTGDVELIDPSKIDSWTSGESYFERSPIQEVVSAIGYKYGAEINVPIKYHGKLYSGSFVHSDFEKACKMVFAPLGIKYTIGVDKQITIQ